MQLLFLGRIDGWKVVSGLAVWLAFAIVAAATARATSYELPRAWTDEMSGYAIGGYDPVDYFVAGRASQPGERAVELYWGGVNWRFRNEGNRAAFQINPDVYVPRFGGADPFMLAAGRPVTGDPTHFDIHDNHLYLFQNGVNLVRWREDRAALLTKAQANWPRLARDLGLDMREPKAPQPPPVEDRAPGQRSQSRSGDAHSSLSGQEMCEPARWSGRAARSSSLRSNLQSRVSKRP